MEFPEEGSRYVTLWRREYKCGAPLKGEQEHGALRRGVHEPFSVHSAIDFNRQSNVSVMDMHAHYTHTHTQLHTYCTHMYGCMHTYVHIPHKVEHYGMSIITNC